MICAILCGIAPAAGAADLYRVAVESAADARALNAAGVDAAVRVRGGYLVLVDARALPALAESGLRYDLIATTVDRSTLALGTHHDGANPGGYPTVYAEDGVRLYRVEPGDVRDRAEADGLASLPPGSRRIVYREPAPREVKQRAPGSLDLETLIALVRQDSLQSYTLQLQAFPNRVTGSLGNRQSRDWLQNRLISYGLDSAYQDSFLYGSTNCQNVIGVKMGTTLPDHRIVVGAHRDAVSGSPGADDNGSGTAAVLEMARVMADIPTEMTWVFALFDSEEQGLNGSYHYAASAAANGDSIIMMLNMDMIGYNGNVNNVSVHYGEDTVWASRWKIIADSLSTNLIGYFSGSASNSDHYPFQQEGYDVVFLIEYNFSTVYHSEQDSTTYMSFPYMRRIVQASLATAYDADGAYLPTPGVLFTEVDPIPFMVPPVDTSEFLISITPGPGGAIAPGSAQVHFRYDAGAWQTGPLADLGGGTYAVPLPGPLCGERVQFYVSAAEVTTGMYTYPDSASPWSAAAATQFTTALADNFETAQGWTVTGNATAGQWARGVPAGGGSRGDPPTDFDGSGQCYLTGNSAGDSDVDGGTTYLTSPTFDATGGDDALVHYARWYSNDFGASPYEDYMDVHVSNNNGSTWTLVERVGPSGTQVSGGWFEHSFEIGDFTAPTNQMRLRFTVGDLGSGSVVEAAVDAVSVTAYTCEEGYFVITTEDLPDWTAGVPYSVQLEAGGGVGARTWADKFGDLLGTGLSLSSGGLVSGTPTASGTIAFTATCTDEADSTVEKAFSFLMNAPVSIATRSLPNGVVGEAYAQTLTAVGGTGGRTWSEPGGGLAGTGLTLAANGLLSGTPTAAGPIGFTARVEDAVGGFDEESFSFVIELPYVCGDVDNSGEAPNVADLTFLVNHLFRGGPMPPVAEAADVNGDGNLTVADLTRLIDFLFRAGGPLECE
ncbi:MAG TPA: M28 family peptidase [candidate division Zixibacteria bacterium]|nr:M28 family peptidase [candidate division Zixibacteria bacterium]MDD4917616.1 M28 family peptidase [candidate division Zixibacteria bacterium]MDM7972125.1 M28 family peptidase [candidate division Zixibacteria bacterium]HPI32178.1 M28 family peptidase [candidate division Zixibacteria bacterium]HPM37004.1 M28 family peptidase [candidate division Zixibacteria bacterium]